MDKSQKLQILSTVTAGIFSGAALYINLVEHPARMTLDIEQAHKQWIPSYTKAARMQLCLSTISCLTSIINALHYASEDKKKCILTAGILIGSVIPFTFAAIMPTNKQLLQNSQLDESGKTNLLNAWGKLHAVRTIASLAAFGLMVYTIVKK